MKAANERLPLRTAVNMRVRTQLPLGKQMPGRLAGVTNFTAADLFEVKPVEIHHLCPCRDKILDELLLTILRGIDFC